VYLRGKRWWYVIWWEEMWWCILCGNMSNKSCDVWRRVLLSELCEWCELCELYALCWICALCEHKCRWVYDHIL